MRRRLATIGITWLALLPVAAAAQEKVTEHTVRAAAGTPPPKASISAMAWLAGHWTGEGLGGVIDEVWTPPAAGAMLGMFRLLEEGSPVFYELFSLMEHEGSLVIRLKHFNPDMSGWEDKDQTVDFPLVAMSGNTAQFSGLTFRRDGEDALTVFLAIGQKAGGPREETFHYRRVGTLGGR